VTVDEQLEQLDDGIRRLKVEWDVYFGGGSARPPADLDWKVRQIIKRFHEGTRLNFGQRFRFNTLAQRHATLNSQWQKKIRIREEGYRRPQDALLGVQGVRITETDTQETHSTPSVSIVFADPERDRSSVQHLFDRMMEMRRESGQQMHGSFEMFYQFVVKKTAQLRADGCDAVEFTLRQEGSSVRLGAKPLS
jgi:hypothetical protein